MRKVWITTLVNIALAGCLVFLLFFYEGTQSSEPEGEGGEVTTASNAEEIINTSCITCHGENLEGGAGPALNKVGSKYSQTEIEDIINNGKNSMPAGVISPEEAKVVAEWLSQKR
ncbi:c-type cytochrome [Lederbergia lenta]|uniref:Cytochrome c551 n=1 Tax=Lederbergia lenta TaxID=1467 RepID=A0A2X4YXN8_LEDLE|nr:cytochrome c [Lederbergia lenta]MCM3112371.1 cytochrome c [Lederbergia lenta]MEC2326590.1 cytochrome c [Lederbergia lenta]SQI53114.1 cytochrome c551 [Lederbergia lenta]